MVMTQEQLEFLTEQTRRAVHKALAWRTRSALIGFLILLFGVGYAVHDTSHRAYKSRGVLCALVTRGDALTYQYWAEGTITASQLQRTLQVSADARRDLAPGKGCYKHVTPPPPQLTAAGRHPHG